jgi:hypothetical protein
MNQLADKDLLALMALVRVSLAGVQPYCRAIDDFLGRVGKWLITETIESHWRSGVNEHRVSSA